MTKEELLPYLPDAPPWLPSRVAMLTKSGSHAYGLNTPESDVDYRGIALEPIEYVVGFANTFEQYQLHSDTVDVCVYGLTKFCKLAAEANPNVLELLFVRDEEIMFTTPQYDLLRKYRGLFLSQKARHTFRGYAYSQLKKIQNKAEYGTTGKRAHIIEKYGFDVKHAMHLVRLMRMGEELLTTGELNVWRGEDREELLAIRQGAWRLDDLVAWFTGKDEELKEVESKLRWGPDLHAIDALCRTILLDSWGYETDIRGR